MYAEFKSGHLKGRACLREIGIDWNIILKFMLNSVCVWNGFVSFRIGSGNGRT